MLLARAGAACLEEGAAAAESLMSWGRPEFAQLSNPQQFKIHQRGVQWKQGVVI